jgi:fluoride ion exporter CrcB/FEX
MVGYVFVGGALGTMLRYLISELITLNLEYPTAELVAMTVVNLLGAYLLGLSAKMPFFQSFFCKNLWANGFAGGFTTMSAVTLFIDSQGLSWEIAAMMFAGVLAYGIGYRQGRIAAKEARE